MATRNTFFFFVFAILALICVVSSITTAHAQQQEQSLEPDSEADPEDTPHIFENFTSMEHFLIARDPAYVDGANCYRVILNGQSGCGKSLHVNLLLQNHTAFLHKWSTAAVTDQNGYGLFFGTSAGREICYIVVNVPGIIDANPDSAPRKEQLTDALLQLPKAKTMMLHMLAGTGGRISGADLQAKQVIDDFIAPPGVPGYFLLNRVPAHIYNDPAARRKLRIEAVGVLKRLLPDNSTDAGNVLLLPDLPQLADGQVDTSSPLLVSAFEGMLAAIHSMIPAARPVEKVSPDAQLELVHEKTEKAIKVKEAEIEAAKQELVKSEQLRHEAEKVADEGEARYVEQVAALRAELELERSRPKNKKKRGLSRIVAKIPVMGKVVGELGKVSGVLKQAADLGKKAKNAVKKAARKLRRRR